MRNLTNLSINENQHANNTDKENLNLTKLNNK